MDQPSGMQLATSTFVQYQNNKARIKCITFKYENIQLYMLTKTNPFYKVIDIKLGCMF